MLQSKLVRLIFPSQTVITYDLLKDGYIKQYWSSAMPTYISHFTLKNYALCRSLLLEDKHYKTKDFLYVSDPRQLEG